VYILYFGQDLLKPLNKSESLLADRERVKKNVLTVDIKQCVERDLVMIAQDTELFERELLFPADAAVSAVVADPEQFGKFVNERNMNGELFFNLLKQTLLDA
jgi:hypothetical protein